MDKAASWKDDLYEFVDEEISGVSIFTEDGLPLLQKGDMQDIVLISANLWLSTADRIVGELDTTDKMDAQLVLSEKYVFIFKHLEKSLLLAAVAKKTSPLEYVVVRTTALAEQLNKALRGTEGLNLLTT